jgi:hypothetical protein
MFFVIIARDKADPALRLEARADHLAFVAGRQDQFVYGGPLLEDGRMVGSILVLDLPDRAALDAYLRERRDLREPMDGAGTGGRRTGRRGTAGPRPGLGAGATRRLRRARPPVYHGFVDAHASLAGACRSMMRALHHV